MFSDSTDSTRERMVQELAKIGELSKLSLNFRLGT